MIPADADELGHLEQLPRCANGRDCADKESILLQAGGTRVYLPQPVDPDSGRAFCPTCVRHLRWTLTALPLDVAELTMLLIPSMQVIYADPDMPSQPRSKKHPPLPLNGTAEALRAHIDHEVTSWAEATAAAAGIEWSSEWASRSRIGHRVQSACLLLSERLDWLLGLDETEYRARSAGEDPTDGHDLDAITRYGDDVWVKRDGTAAALLLLDLHRQVERFVGRTPADRCPVPCPRCHRQTLFREHARQVVTGSLRLGTEARVVCRSCWRPMTDASYEQLVDITSALFGVRT